MNPASDTAKYNMGALAPVYQKLDRLEQTMATINDIAADANRSIRQGRYQDLVRYQHRLAAISRQTSSDRADKPA
ncbi:MAG: hypothetical protein NXI24_01020 [bacterium]|nr:hypothetical protein [bacterium]